MDPAPLNIDYRQILAQQGCFVQDPFVFLACGSGGIQTVSMCLVAILALVRSLRILPSIPAFASCLHGCLRGRGVRASSATIATLGCRGLVSSTCRAGRRGPSRRRPCLACALLWAPLGLRSSGMGLPNKAHVPPLVGATGSWYWDYAGQASHQRCLCSRTISTCAGRHLLNSLTVP